MAAHNAVSAKPQCMLDLPNCNFIRWTNALGGVLEKAGEGLDALHYILIGGGLSNLFLACHLRKAGAQVTVLEARSQLAGRTEHHVLSDGTEAPMGMMRYGRGQALWIELLEKFDYVLKSGFPDPGVAPTLIVYNDERTLWTDGNTAPGHFETVYNGYHNFLANGYEDLTSWHDIRSYLQNEQSEEARQAIQSWLTRFSGYSFRQALDEIFAHEWSENDYVRFGVLGIGAGGYEPFFDTSLFSVMRLAVNGFEDAQGSIGYWDGYNYKEISPQDVVQELGDYASGLGVTIELNTAVNHVEESDDTIVVCTEDGSQHIADHGVVGTTLPAMVNDIHGLSAFIDNDTWAAISSHGKCPSGKCFALVDVSNTPDVNNENFPRMLLSDQITPQIYMLPAHTPHHRLILMWYGWYNTYESLADENADDILSHCKNTVNTIVTGSQYEQAWRDMMDNIIDSTVKKWPLDNRAQLGFHNPDQIDNEGLKNIIFHWKNNEEKTGSVVHLNGDYVTGAGGWCEGGLLSSLMILSSELKKRGTLYQPDNAPCNILDRDTLQY